MSDNDYREMPRAVGRVFVLMLLFVGAVAFTATRHNVWVMVIVSALAAWGIFGGLMVAYRLGMVKAYRDAAEWAEEVRRSMRAGRVELNEIAERLDFLNERFQGPS